MKLLVFGAGGMLGAEVVLEAKRRGINVTAPLMDISKPELMTWYRDVLHPDVVINCAGAIPGSKRFVNATEVIRSNALGPHVLANVFDGYAELIHVSTDCVFDSEEFHSWFSHQKPNATSFYGRSKALGEPANAVVVRTSFIGPKHGLLAWLLSQPHGATVEGWVNAFWNGGTVYGVARSLLDMAVKCPLRGTVHLSGHMTTKYDLIHDLNSVLNLGLVVEPITEPRVNRTLRPTIWLERRLDEFTTSRECCNPSRAV